MTSAETDIVVHDGPAGPRPGLRYGPDIWEVVDVHRSFSDIERTASWLSLPADAIRVALGYYDDHRDEIDAWIRNNEAAAERAQLEAR